MLIGITGTDGAGKGAVVSYLVEHGGFVHYSARSIWEEEFRKRGMDNNRANMRLVANELRATHGNYFLVVFFLKKKSKDATKKAIIESIRATAEVDTLKANGGILLAVDADKKVRYKRIKGRRSGSDQVSFEEFIAQEALEMNDPDPNGMQKAKVISMADYTILNNGTMGELKKEVDKFLQTINND